MPGAGALHNDDFADARDESNWTLTVALAGVVLVALVVGVLALTDTRPRIPGPSDDAIVAAPAPTTATSSSPSTTGPATTDRPTTVPQTTARPTTTAPPTTSPPTTASPTTAPPTSGPSGPSPLPDGWVAVVSTDGGFRAEFPTTPAVTAPVVPGPDGDVARLEYNAAGPEGSTISVTSVPVPLRGRPVEEVLDGAAGQIRQDVGGILRLGERTAVDDAPGRRFVIDVSGGRIRGLAAHRDDVLYTVMMFEPARAGAAATAAFERVATSFRLL